MKKNHIAKAVCVITFPVLALCAPSIYAVNDHHPGNFKLVFADEFDGNALDRDKWCTRYLYGGGASPQVPDSECQKNGEGTLDFLNDEQQRYVDFNRDGETMHVVANGVLSLKSTKTRTDDSWASYESAMIRAKKIAALQVPSSKLALYYTARVKLPDVVGTWPAFWLAPDYGENNSTAWPPEIDIFEAALNGVDDTKFMLHQAGIIQGDQTSSGSRNYTYVDENFDTTWNNYHSESSLRETWVEVALLWTDKEACYFIDGLKTACEEYRWYTNSGAKAGPPQLLLNLAVGGGWAGRYGIDDSKFPSAMQIDHVRVYAGDPNADSPPPADEIDVCGRPDFSAKSDQGIFIWKNCAIDSWIIKVSSGGAAGGVKYDGKLTSSEGFNVVTPVGFESHDSLTQDDTSVDFTVGVWNGGIDGIKVILPETSITCFSSISTAENNVYVGLNKVLMAVPFDLNTRKRCDI